MSLKLASAAALITAMFAMSTPAAATVTALAQPQLRFGLTSGNNNNIADGNARFFKASTQRWGTYNVRATGWSLEMTNQGVFVRDSKLMVYAGAGLGVLSGDDGSGDRNRHTVDNQTRLDFILLQFDRAVQLTSVTLNAYRVSGQSTADTDALFTYGSTETGWSDSLQLDNAPLARLNSLFSGRFTSPGGSASGTRAINPDLKGGNLWLVGADFANTDRRIDGFKLAGLSAIPEPATWAMMISGFGLAGVAARRRRAAIAFA